ncbi:WbqC family protein [Candidatus Micrarchaeota archaeon]|nr:WbqC family protein [Candidatus Micrarchaeota archaeon]
MVDNIIVAIHQPNYLPWLGYFNKMKMADTFILYDTAQYPKNSLANRNKIRTKDGSVYLTIPVEKEYHFRPVCEVKLPKDGRWREKHLASLKANYARADYFESYKDEIERVYKIEEFDTLADVSIRLINFVKDEFDIGTRLVRSSELDIDRDRKQTDALIAMVEAVGGAAYFTGSGGSKDYLDQTKFIGIKLMWHKYEHPRYKQAFPGFEPYMAAIDAIFNLGEKAKALV